MSELTDPIIKDDICKQNELSFSVVKISVSQPSKLYQNQGCSETIFLEGVQGLHFDHKSGVTSSFPSRHSILGLQDDGIKTKTGSSCHKQLAAQQNITRILCASNFLASNSLLIVSQNRLVVSSANLHMQSEKVLGSKSKLLVNSYEFPISGNV